MLVTTSSTTIVESLEVSPEFTTELADKNDKVSNEAVIDSSCLRIKITIK